MNSLSRKNLMFNNQFISFEGLSGVGKSTISRLYAEKIGAKLIGTIPESFSSLRKILDTPTTNIHARFLFYLAAVLEGEKSLKVALCSKNVVVESYLYRTIAFHRGMGSNLDISIPEDILLPNVVFYLTCEEKERQRRRVARGKRETYWDCLAERNADNILHEYQHFKMDSIDTTHLKPEEIVDKLINRFGKKYG